MSLHPDVEGFPLSPQQRRIWGLQRRRGAPLAVQAVLAAGAERPEELRDGLEREVGRWEIFRTGFGIHPRFRLPVQTILTPAVGWRQRTVQAGELDQAAVRAAAEDRAAVPYYREDPAAGVATVAGSAAGPPPLLATLVTEEGGEARLILTLPALCADPRTLILLAAALNGRGADPESGPAALQYADLADWLNGMVSGEDGEAGRRYWRERGIGAGLGLRLPFGGPGDPAAGPLVCSVPVPLGRTDRKSVV